VTSVTRIVGGNACLLHRSITIFNQHHDGFVAAAFDLFCIWIFLAAMLALSFDQFIKTHCHGHCSIMQQINLWHSKKGAQPEKKDQKINQHM
jgi:hypothetical protein